MRKWFVIGIMFLAFAGCGTTYARMDLNEFIGYTRDELVLELGVPTNNHELDNGSVLLEFIRSTPAGGTEIDSYLRFVLENNVVVRTMFEEDAW